MHDANRNVWAKFDEAHHQNPVNKINVNYYCTQVSPWFPDVFRRPDSVVDPFVRRDGMDGHQNASFQQWVYVPNKC